MGNLTDKEKAQILANYSSDKDDEYADVYASIVIEDIAIVHSSDQMLESNYLEFKEAVRDYYSVEVLWAYQDKGIKWEGRKDFKIYLFHIDIGLWALSPMNETSYLKCLSTSMSNRQIAAFNSPVPDTKMQEEVTRQFCAVNKRVFREVFSL